VNSLKGNRKYVKSTIIRAKKGDRKYWKKLEGDGLRISLVNNLIASLNG